MVSGSQALEKVWLFSVPLHPMLILWKHVSKSDILGPNAYLSDIENLVPVSFERAYLCQYHHFEKNA